MAGSIWEKSAMDNIWYYFLKRDCQAKWSVYLMWVKDIEHTSWIIHTGPGGKGNISEHIRRINGVEEDLRASGCTKWWMRLKITMSGDYYSWGPNSGSSIKMMGHGRPEFCYSVLSITSYHPVHQKICILSNVLSVSL